MTLYHEVLATPPRHPEIGIESDADLIEQRIIRAYVQLVFPQADEKGCRTVTLGRIDNFEVCLTEVALPKNGRGYPQQLEMTFDGEPHYLLELRCPMSGTVAECMGIREFDEDELEHAVEFVQNAVLMVRNLH
jgi:hypothetical protein